MKNNFNGSKIAFCIEIEQGLILGGRISGENYTRNEWRRCKTTLEMSGEDVKLHSKQVLF